jgi:hypothetical protein
MSVEEAYKRWLFHGPCLQGISKIEGFNEKGIGGTVVPSSPSVCLRDEVKGAWLIDPALVDSGLQLSILWVRAHYDMMPLISSIKSYRRFGPVPDQPVHCWAEARASAGGHVVSASFYFVDAEGKLISLIEDMEASCSKELNRLTEGVSQ